MTAARLALELVRAEIRERALPPATALAHLKAALDADDGGDPLRTRLIAVELLLRSWLEEQRGGDGALSAPEWNRLEELCAQLGRTAPGDDPARGALKILRAERHLRLGDTRASTYNESRTENESGDAMRAKQKIGMLAMTTMLLACGGESQKVEAGDQGAERPTGFEGLIGDGPQKPETGGKTGAGSGPGTAGIGGKVGSGGAGSADALPAGPLPTLTDNSVAALVEADFAKASVEDQKDLRYLSFAHLGETDPVEVETLRIGVEKLLNSLSMADDIVRLEPVGSARSVYKMRLSRYEWTAATWQRVEGGEHAAGNVERLASGAVLAKADWLVFSATRPEVYDRILELPPLESMLESRLGVDR